MAGEKQGNNSSSSFTAELFGAKESSPQQSGAGIFASIFPPPSKVGGRNSPNSDLMGSWQKPAPGNQAWPTTKHGSSAISGEGASCSMPNKDKSYVLQEERVEPCHLSSSLYYGGQDVYSRSPSTQTSASYPIFKKDGGEDDPNGSNSSDASRGNWWQGPCPPRPHEFRQFFEKLKTLGETLCNINKQQMPEDMSSQNLQTSF